jgi:nicotinamide-nucleotide amidase
VTAEIISVGTELLLGEIVDTNAAFLARTLAELGVFVHHKTTVGDNPGRLADALRLALSRSDCVVLGGGLGPTPDDLTKEVTAEVLGVPLVVDGEAERRLRSFFAERGLAMPERNVKQALAFEGGCVFQNDHGTAPGLAVQRDGKTVILLPGPPGELIPMVRDKVVPYLEGLLGPGRGALVSRLVKIAGMGESLVAERLGSILEGAQPTVATYAKSGEVHVRVAASGNRDEATALVESMVVRIRERLGDAVFGMDDDTLESVVLSSLRAGGMTLGGAESCTGGLVAQRLTSVPGASDVFAGAVVAYCNRSKEALLGVSEATLSRFGAVSAETAREMAVGARSAFGADCAYAVTGIAGPGGGTEAKPVGLVFVAACRGDRVEAREYRFRGRRDVVRHLSAQAALNLLRNLLRG